MSDEPAPPSSDNPFRAPDPGVGPVPGYPVVPPPAWGPPPGVHPAYGGGPAPYAGMPWPVGWPGQAPRNALGTAALVLGIVGVAAALTVVGSLLGVPLGVLALVFGVVGRRRARRGGATNGGQALTGAILGGVAAVASVVLLVVLVVHLDREGGIVTGRTVALTSSRGTPGTPLEAGMTATYADGTWVTVGRPRLFVPPVGARGHRAGAKVYAFDVTVDETGDQALSLDDYGWKARATRGGQDGTDLKLISAGSGPLSRDFPGRLASGHQVTEVFAFDMPDGPYSLRFGFRAAPRFAPAEWKLFPGA